MCEDAHIFMTAIVFGNAVFFESEKSEKIFWIWSFLFIGILLPTVKIEFQKQIFIERYKSFVMYVIRKVEFDTFEITSITPLILRTFGQRQ